MENKKYTIASIVMDKSGTMSIWYYGGHPEQGGMVLRTGLGPSSRDLPSLLEHLKQHVDTDSALKRIKEIEDNLTE